VDEPPHTGLTSHVNKGPSPFDVYATADLPIISEVNHTRDMKYVLAARTRSRERRLIFQITLDTANTRRGKESDIGRLPDEGSD
jgi:hypothetical protein